MTDLLRWGGTGFSEKQSPWDRIAGGMRHLSQPRGIAVLGVAAALGLAGSVFCGALALRYERLAAAERQAARTVEIANADLQDALTRLRDQLGGSNQALNTAQRRVDELADEAQRQVAASEQNAATRADRIAQLARALEQTQRDLHLAEAQRATLMARLSKSEVDFAQDQARQQQQMQAGHDQLNKKVQQLAVDREKVVSERDRLRARVGELEQRLSLLQTRQPPRPVAEARPAPTPQAVVPQAVVPTAPVVASVPPAEVHAATVPAPVAVAPAPVAAAPVAAVPVPAAPAPVTAAAVPQAAYATTAYAPPPMPNTVATAPAPAVAREGVVQFERVLASAGVDVKHLFAQFGVNRGEGGPFIPAPGGAPTQISAEKLAALSQLVKSLPVSAPLQGYEIGSRFGVRGDPINSRASLHTGTDFRAPYMSPVYATAAGVVTFSGYRSDYGRIVEIDHGNGISTRYGHLHRATVSVGQRVAAHSQVGFLGSTGRSTGPHVHYEVLVNGEPQDAEKFMSLGRIIPVLARR